MKIKAILILVFLCVLHGYSQQNASYHLKVDYSGMNKNYKIEFIRSEEIKLVVVKRSNTSRKLSAEDSLKVLKLTQGNGEESRAKLMQLTALYKEYETDTLSIRPGTPIVKLVDDFVKSWEKIKREQDSNPDHRIFLDGYSLKLSLAGNNRNYEDMYTHSPTSESHPRIFELTSALEKFYKLESKEPILD